MQNSSRETGLGQPRASLARRLARSRLGAAAVLCLWLGAGVLAYRSSRQSEEQLSTQLFTQELNRSSILVEEYAHLARKSLELSSIPL